MNFFNSTIKQLLFVIVLLVVYLFSPVVLAANYYVDANATAPGNGDQATPWTNLQSAFAQIDGSGNDTIHIAQGTYKPGTTRGSSFAMTLTKRASIIGGYPGVTTGTPWGTPNPSLYPTILSGDIGNVGDTSDNCYTVFKISNSNMTNSDVIQGITIRDGRGDNAGLNPSDFEQRTGAGVRITAGAPRFHNVTITNNGVLEHGAGVYVEGASPVFTQCTIEVNIMIPMPLAGYNPNGGGLCAGDGSHVKLINSIIRNNLCHAGGGIAAQSIEEGKFGTVGLLKKAQELIAWYPMMNEASETTHAWTTGTLAGGFVRRRAAARFDS